MTVGLSASMLLQWYRFMPTQSELSLIIHSWTISQFDFCNIRLPSSATALLCHEMISVTMEISLTQIQQASWRLRAWGNFVFIPLSVSMHINHFTFIHLHFHNMLVIVTIISAFPPFLVSSFIALISAPPPSTPSLRHSLSISIFTVFNASYLFSPHLFHPPNAFSSTSTPRKISFSLSPDGNETFIPFWDFSPWGPP